MSVEAVSAFPVVASDAFLLNDDFGRTLTKKVGGLPEFRMRCRQFIDRLIVVIVGSITVTSGVSRCFYSFCPGTLFEGDDSGVFALFADLCRLLKTCGLITEEESSRSVDEFGSYVIEKRGQHRSSEQSANSIVDVIEYLMQDFSFQSRIHLLRVFKLCCLAVRTLDVSYPSVSISLSGSSLVESAMQNCIKMIQSYVLSEGYSHQAFFTGQTMEAVRAAVDEAGVFFVCGGINLWISLVLRTLHLCLLNEICVLNWCSGDEKNTRVTILNATKLISWLVWIKVQKELVVRLGVRSRDHQELPVESLQREAP